MVHVLFSPRSAASRGMMRPYFAVAARFILVCRGAATGRGGRGWPSEGASHFRPGGRGIIAMSSRKWGSY
jgi:hypothetical protein